MNTKPQPLPNPQSDIIRALPDTLHGGTLTQEAGSEAIRS